MKQMGAKIQVGNGSIEAEVKGRLQGAKIYLISQVSAQLKNIIGGVKD
ncbi:hypothetical protein ACEQPO_27365 [Bacillus sp. SL00103]